MGRVIAVSIVLLLMGGCSSFQGYKPGDIYLRADLSYSNARSAGLQDDNPGSPECVMQTAGGGACSGSLGNLGNGTAFGVGAGYRFTDMIRGDLTYQRRSGYSLSGADSAGTNFDPPVTSDSVMVSGYLDIPVEVQSVRPYIGLGIGRSRNEMDPLKWNDPGCCSGTLTGGKATSTAWQVTLGANILLDKSWTLEMFYRYADMGDIKKERGADQAGLFGTGVTGSMTGKLRTDEFGISIRFGLP
jgi:opacity protein-like surface antigen